MTFANIPALVALLTCPLALTGCGSDPLPPLTSESSVGQQLNDLEDARQRGIISDSEYKRLKKALIKRYD